MSPFSAPTLLGDAQFVSSPSADRSRYTSTLPGGGLRMELPQGLPPGPGFLWFDLLLEHDHCCVFDLALVDQQDQDFHLSFALLPWCQARLRFDLAHLNLNRWMLEREGALLKPLCNGKIVEPEALRYATLTLLRTSALPVQWQQTLPSWSATPPPLLEEPELPRGPLLDPLGQLTLRDWPGKARNAAEIDAGIRGQMEDSAWPENFSDWGGDTRLRFAATGFFRVQRTDARWYLVDPDGCAFFSTGPDCVNPGNPTVLQGLEAALSTPAPSPVLRRGQRSTNYPQAHLARVFGPDWPQTWETLTLRQLRRFGFNTVGNWSDWAFASKHRFPYVRPLTPSFPNTPTVFRDLPDVYHPAFAEDCAAFAEQLRETREDPALIGYFLMNEPTWGFAAQSPAEGMLHNAEPGPALEALRRFAPTPTEDELIAFSEQMVGRFFTMLSEACRRVDPHHLNLGVRPYRLPEPWLLRAMRCFDVFSFNCYEDLPPDTRMQAASEALDMPLLIGEWHFGALDRGLPATGIGAVATQDDRARAFSAYLERSAAHPCCVGAHWFQWNDQSPLGRFDGECYNIGMLDSSLRPYPELANACRQTHESLYDLVHGWRRTTEDLPTYLPRLFF